MKTLQMLQYCAHMVPDSSIYSNEQHGFPSIEIHAETHKMKLLVRHKLCKTSLYKQKVKLE